MTGAADLFAQATPPPRTDDARRDRLRRAADAAEAVHADLAAAGRGDLARQAADLRDAIDAAIAAPRTST